MCLDRGAAPKTEWWKGSERPDRASPGRAVASLPVSLCPQDHVFTQGLSHGKELKGCIFIWGKAEKENWSAGGNM